MHFICRLRGNSPNGFIRYRRSRVGKDALRAYETKQGIFALPSRFSPMFAVGTQTIPSATGTLAELAEYASRHPEPLVHD